MTKVLTLDELKAGIGRELAPGDWFTIDQTLINRFADVTQDHQYIHTDPERARQTPFGGTIAHGFLILSLLTRLIQPSDQKGADLTLPEGKRLGINYGFNKVRFLNPVKVNSQIRLRRSLVAVEEKQDGKILTITAVTVEIKGEDKPALVGEWLNMLV
jgi:acyl dehydratase